MYEDRYEVPSNTNGGFDKHVPNLIRTSSLNPEYIRQYANLVNTPVKLIFEGNVESMTENWSPQEMTQERRLVKFQFKRLSPTDFSVQFFPINIQDFTPDAPIISCIYWKEKEKYIVTSVDIILVLEYLVQESFSVEEKNRIRRNLQSLKPYTIARSNKSFQRFFNLLMSMEDPRPRNIEKDLKVFNWLDLFVAINKVIAKYTTNALSLQKEFSVPKPYNPTKLGTTDPASYTPNPAGNGRRLSDLLSAVPTPASFEHRKFSDHHITNPNSIQPSAKHHQPHSTIHGNGFVPSERLKVLKRKVNHTTPTPKSPFQHVLMPSDPVPMEQDVEMSKNSSTDTYNGDNMEVDGGSSTITDNSENSPNNGSDEGSDELTPSSDEKLSRSDDSSSDNSSGRANKIMEADAVRIKENGLSSSSLNNGTNPGSNGDQKSNAESDSPTNTGSRSSGSNINSVFSNTHNSSSQASSKSSGNNSAGSFNRNKHRRQNHDKAEAKNIEVNGFTSDQTNRVFGLTVEKKPAGFPNQYYQYPTLSQLYHPKDPVDMKEVPLSMANVKIHDDELKQKSSRHQQLPSLKDNISMLERPIQMEKNNEAGIQLPPITNIPAKFPLPGPQEVDGYCKGIGPLRPNNQKK